MFWLFGENARKIVFYYRFSCFFREKGHRKIAKYILLKISTKYGCYIGQNTQIGLGIKFPHPTGIVIGEDVIIGNNCIIYQQVTLGGARIGDAKESNYPQIGDNVTIFAGAKIVGNVLVNDNSTIGANSVVLKDIPANSTCAGIPSRVIKHNN